MGRLLLVGRLAVRDLRRRRTEAALLLLAVLAATTTLTLGLVLRDAAADPYRSTQAATRGPDVVAGAQRAEQFAGLAEAAGVSGHSGPYPVQGGEVHIADRTADVQVMGRDTAAAAVDQPDVIRGGWVRDGGMVVEAAFAAALDVSVGDRVTLGGRSFVVAGVAVTSAMAPYPASTCVVYVPCLHGERPEGQSLPPDLLDNPGVVWVTRADLSGLGAGDPTYVMNLRLADPAAAAAFVGGDHGRLRMWSAQEIQTDATEVAADSQILLLIGAWLLALLAAAGLAVLVGGRLADQTRRVGLLKAVGGTPGLVAVVLLAEYVLVAVAAAVAGLILGSLTAPLLTEASAGLVGSAGVPLPTLPTIGLVLAVALAVAVVATAVPALRAARSSTVRALADTPRPPRRIGWLVAVSARLPVPLLLAARIAARRLRRVVLGAVSVAVTVSGIYVLLILYAFLADQPPRGYGESQVATLQRVLLVWTVILLGLAAVNTIVVTWATVLDNRRSSALARALGATPGQVTVALAAVQVLPALAGALIGAFPGGYALFSAIMVATDGDGDRATRPSAGQGLAVVLATVLVVVVLTAVPARLGGRRPVVEAL
jgi:ABC-type lipoprotein release transport system permease subunit